MKIKNLFIISCAIMLALPLSAQTRKGTRTRTTTTTTKKPSQQATISKPQLVDLGLPSGTKWADRNIDARSTTSVGGYYAYGETTTKKLYSEDNYTFDADLDDIAGTEYDVATKKYGKGWSIPTMEQWQELFDNSTRKLVTINNQSVLKLTGPNGKFIYLSIPASNALVKTAMQNRDLSAESSKAMYESAPVIAQFGYAIKVLKANGGTGKVGFAVYRAAEKGVVYISGYSAQIHGESKSESRLEKETGDVGGFMGLPIHPVFNDTIADNAEDTDE